MNKQALVIATLAIIAGFVPGTPAFSTSITVIPWDCFAIANEKSIDVAETILNGAEPNIGLLPSGGCYVWQQPGVALVITSIWQGDQPVELYFNPEKLNNFLEAIPSYISAEPFLHPPEPDNSDEFFIEPQVYFLNREQSRSRLREYMVGYGMWMGFNEGAEFVLPDDKALLTDFAMVYIDSSGPLEFHYRWSDRGFKLQHIFLWDFFSA